ncbi:HIT family protein [Microbacterium lacticum]|uniref:HIT family protein n=2 Tax=Microbacterium TaxID=33882 RepID=UPI0037C8D2A0
MIAPRRHLVRLEDLTATEVTAIHARITELQHKWARDGEVASVNVVWNLGASAGQTVEHVHCHVLERGREGDVLPGYGPRWWLKRHLRARSLLRLVAWMNPSLGSTESRER